jgi:putative tricarboxylic transport membrane protein
MRFLLALLAALLLATHASAATWKPERTVEIVAMSGPGGANDVIARAIQQYLQNQKLVGVPVIVTNRPGAGGAIAWNYLNQRAGDGGYLSVSPINLLTEHIAGAAAITYTDVTPIAQLFNEYVVFSVKADSPIRNGTDLVQQLRPDPGALTIAVAAALGGANHLGGALAMKAAGIDPRKLRFVVYNSGPQSIAAVLGGHIDVAVTPVSGAVTHLQSNRLRLLAVSAPKRLSGAMAGVPTWREQGVDSVFSSWRGVIGPKGMTPEQIAYWESVLTRIVQSDEWKRDMERNYWESSFMTSAATLKFLRSQYEQYRGVLGELGLAKQP